MLEGEKEYKHSEQRAEGTRINVIRMYNKRNIIVIVN